MKVGAQLLCWPYIASTGKGFGFAIYSIGGCSIVGLSTVYSIKEKPATVYIIRSLLIILGTLITALSLVLPKLLWVDPTKARKPNKSRSASVSPAVPSRKSQATGERGGSVVVPTVQEEPVEVALDPISCADPDDRSRRRWSEPDTPV